MSEEDVWEELTSALKNPKTQHDQDSDLRFHLRNRKGTKRKKKIFPDIIIHERGTHARNHIVIEAKKSSSKVSKSYDLVKLATLVNTAPYNYKRGIFIDLPVKTHFSDSLKFVMKKTLYPNVFEYTYCS